MNQQPGREKCSCGGGAAGAPAPSAHDDVTKVLKAQVPQDYEVKFNLRIVPGRSLKDVAELPPRCRPRGHAQGWTPGLLGVGSELVATLAKADKAMVAWLAKDKANTQRFLANPVAAMREAGVELTRADEKSLVRASTAAGAARMVPPGVKVASVAAEAFPKGRVGGIGVSTPGGKTEDFGCGPKRKG